MNLKLSNTEILKKKLWIELNKNMEKKNNENGRSDKIKEIISDEKQITEALQHAVREAVEMHKRSGNPIAAWKDGKAVWVETK